MDIILNDYINIINYGIVFSATIITLYIIKVIIVAHFKKLSKKTKNNLDDLIINFLEKIHLPFYLIVGLYFTDYITSYLTGRLKSILDNLFLIGIVFYLTLFTQEIIIYFFQKTIKEKQNEDKNFDSNPLHIFQNIIKYFLWLLSALILLDNLGYNISALIAGLGIGGIAIAFALQNILADLFSFVSIFLDKPFKIGDFIAFEQNRGTVKSIGIKTTRILTLQGEELIVPNKKLTDLEIHNFRQMKERRIIFTIDIIYETNPKKVEKARNIIKTIFKNIEGVTLERVHFKALGPHSLVFEIAYLVKNRDYLNYLNKQEEINLKLLKQFKKEEIEFAYPTQKIFVDKTQTNI